MILQITLGLIVFGFLAIIVSTMILFLLALLIPIDIELGKPNGIFYLKIKSRYNK
ncbi:hypothetical protein [Clostridium botulinum]|uniref:hypothetical protein n=1 Tax=Clostridium botulinum TaxID=1491 RepID=UPI001E4C3A8F|nr:hypothetical protein [Clostridium botulinum]MCD3329309.1 hypothetical protein [Clostridium botulinum D/C]MCD3344528.1 hypothetical protein [Clostridium botulinum D/C]MCD3353008.1 hypothetical protein [Clostridium botulinum D/C]